MLYGAHTVHQYAVGAMSTLLIAFEYERGSCFRDVRTGERPSVAVVVAIADRVPHP